MKFTHLYRSSLCQEIVVDCHNLGHPTGDFSDLIIQNNTKFQKFDRFLIDNFFCDSFQVFDDLTSFSNNPIILILIGICIHPNMPSFIQHISSLLRTQCLYCFCSAYSSLCLLCIEDRVTGECEIVLLTLLNSTKPLLLHKCSEKGGKFKSRLDSRSNLTIQ